MIENPETWNLTYMFISSVVGSIIGSFLMISFLERMKRKKEEKRQNLPNVLTAKFLN